MTTLKGKTLHEKIAQKIATMDEWIEWETRERKASLWGDYTTIKPVISKEIVGDGKQLIYIGTIDQRPNFWLIRIDGKIDIHSDEFNIEKYLEILEDEFGRADEEDETIFDAIDKVYPAVLWSGGHWGSLFIEI